MEVQEPQQKRATSRNLFDSLESVQDTEIQSPFEDAVIGSEEAGIELSPDGERVVRMLIPNSTVGSAIGRAGCCINEIRERSAAAITILKSDKQQRYRSPMDPIPDFTVVRIEGNYEAVSAAQQYLTRVVYDLEVSRNGGVSPHHMRASRNQDADSDVDPDSALALENGAGPAELRFLVPETCCGLIIGKGGAAISALEQLAGCEIRIKKMEPATMYSTRNYFDPEVTVVAVGNMTSLMQVFVIVSERCHEAIRTNTGLSRPRRPRPQYRGYGEGGVHIFPQDLGGILTETFTLPPQMVGDVIGRGGRRIQEFNRLSGASIHISKEFAPGTNEREVRIKGTRAAIDRARDLIAEHCARSKYETTTQTVAAPSVMPVGTPMGVSEYAQETTIMLGVPTPDIGAVIGRRGTTIRAIQAESQTRIHVRTEAEMGHPRDPNGVVEVEVTGTQTGIEVATRLIQRTCEGSVYPIDESTTQTQF